MHIRTSGRVALADLLGQSSLIALVGSGDVPSWSTRQLRLVNTSKLPLTNNDAFPSAVLEDTSSMNPNSNLKVCDEFNQHQTVQITASPQQKPTLATLNFLSSITSVSLRPSYLLVALETKLYIFALSTLQLMHTLDSGMLSPKSICFNPPTLLVPSEKQGDLLILSLSNGLQLNQALHAHSSSVSAVALSDDQSLIATSSQTGTLIRVFTVANGFEKLLTLRRGTQPKLIKCICFNQNANLLAVASESSVHIFPMVEMRQRGDSPVLTNQKSFTKWGSRIASSVSQTLSNLASSAANATKVSDWMDPRRAACKIKCTSVVSMSFRQSDSTPNAGQLMSHSLNDSNGDWLIQELQIITSDGNVQIHRIVVTKSLQNLAYSSPSNESSQNIVNHFVTSKLIRESRIIPDQHSEFSRCTN